MLVFRDAGDGVNDGLWHSISVSMKDRQVSLVLDGESPLTVELGEHGFSEGSFFFGGEETPGEGAQVGLIINEIQRA